MFAEGDAAKDAEEAGADFVGGEELAKKVQGGWLDFDVTPATPEMMQSHVSKLGRVLQDRAALCPVPRPRP